MRLACDDLEHVAVVRGRLLARATEAGLSAPVSGYQVEGDLAKKSEVARSRPVAHPAVILAEGDVQHPMQRVLNAPVPADRRDQDSGIIVAACQEIADLGRNRAGAVDAPDRLDCENRPQVRPAVQGLEVLDRQGHETRRRTKRPWPSSKASNTGRLLYDLRLISSGWLAWATSGSLSRD